MTDPYGRNQIPDPPPKRPRFNWPKWLAWTWIALAPMNLIIGGWQIGNLGVPGPVRACACIYFAVSVFLAIFWMIAVDDRDGPGHRARWEKRNGFREE